jgi:hypothetical protein
MPEQVSQAEIPDGLLQPGRHERDDGELPLLVTHQQIARAIQLQRFILDTNRGQQGANVNRGACESVLRADHDRELLDVSRGSACCEPGEYSDHGSS